MDSPILRRASRAGSCPRSSVATRTSQTRRRRPLRSPVASGSIEQIAAVSPIKAFYHLMRMTPMLPAYPARSNEVRARHAANLAVSA